MIDNSNHIQPIFKEKVYVGGKGSSSSSHLWLAQLNIASCYFCNREDVPWFTEKITLQSVTVKVSGFVSHLENSHVLSLVNQYPSDSELLHVSLYSRSIPLHY